jgi:hypothetical protein
MLPVICVKFGLQVPPLALSVICMGASNRVDEAKDVIHGQMRVTFLVEILVRPPTIADDRSAWFDPGTHYGHQSFGGSIRNRNEKRSTRISVDPAEHPLPLNGVAPVIFLSTKLLL